MRPANMLLMLLTVVSGLRAQTSPHGNIQTPCSSCHTTESWSMRPDASFDHSTTAFPLSGQHKAVTCASCHEGLKFADTRSTCASCHTDIHRAELGNDCTRCHSTQSWSVSDMIQRHQQTRFPLVGRHATATCQECHEPSRGTQYAGTPVTCVGCHHNDFTSTTRPNHIAAGFASDCQMCHRVNSELWGSGFDHAQSGFPLTGAHIAIPCADCHAGNRFKGTTNECATCHATDVAAVTEPNHTAARFSSQCQTCHTTVAWKPSSFSHDNTAFPLVGAHRAVICASCHVNNVYAGLSSACVPCHQSDYTNATDPSHAAGSFSTQCLTCHSMNSWEPATFDHASTSFPLTGQHLTTACISCHVSGNYQLAYQNCYQCHQTDFQQAQSPNHAALGFSQDCQLCHSTSGWGGAAFDHSTTAFALTGQHVSQSCTACHVNNNYQLTFQSCSQCHQSDYQQAQNPNHVTLAFSQDCQTCHSTNGWSGAAFDHSTTGFALTGQHVSQSCAACHVNNNYQISFQSCYQCHQTDYQQTQNPNHVALAFSQECQTCHSTSGWSGATFDHSTSGFPLTGQHTATSCVSCHVNNNYQLEYQDCYQCHQSDYARPTNPNHASLLFSHRCESCHNTTAWTPSSFNHDQQFFRIYSGKHAGEWQTCGQCHPTLGQYTTFTCLSCHEHNQTEVDSEHREVTGYVYASPNCYSCHRNV